MEKFTGIAFPRAALVGNPSDGYHGKTIAFVFSNFQAEVEIEPSDLLEIVPGERDNLTFSSLGELVQGIDLYGYYGGIRLIKAALKVFYTYFTREGFKVPAANFRISYRSNIPNRLGLAGSSAIITATFRALMGFYKVELPPPLLAMLVLSVETKELRIPAGLQDRVAQAYEQPVFMNFSREKFDPVLGGQYEPFPKSWLPDIYLAFDRGAALGSEVSHADLRERFEQGQGGVRQAMHGFAQLTDQAMGLMRQGRGREIGPLLDQNFELRKTIMALNPRDVRMVELARGCGVSAKFTGSGGAIIGTYEGENQFNHLKTEMKKSGIEVIKPAVMGN
ncbi:MAG: GHMP kinase [Bacteroidia bacterium]|nr:GHMP kinase [Bacteroidia bacterium]